MTFPLEQAWNRLVRAWMELKEVLEEKESHTRTQEETCLETSP